MWLVVVDEATDAYRRTYRPSNIIYRQAIADRECLKLLMLEYLIPVLLVWIPNLVIGSRDPVHCSF